MINIPYGGTTPEQDKKIKLMSDKIEQYVVKRNNELNAIKKRQIYIPKKTARERVIDYVKDTKEKNRKVSHQLKSREQMQKEILDKAAERAISK